MQYEVSLKNKEYAYSSVACTKTRNAETKPPKQNDRNGRNETTETNETTEMMRS